MSSRKRSTIPSGQRSTTPSEQLFTQVSEQHSTTPSHKLKSFIPREAMANQMAHADYFSPRRSCIHAFDDRIEFLNPGAMPMPLDVMETSFESQPRNPVIAKLFRLAHLSENLGYGLRKLKSWQPESASAVAATRSLPGALSRFSPEETTGSA